MKNKAAQEMARKRAESMTAARRKEIATKAGKARWAKRGVIPDVGKSEKVMGEVFGAIMPTRTVTVKELRKEYPEPPRSKVGQRPAGHRKGCGCNACLFAAKLQRTGVKE